MRKKICPRPQCEKEYLEGEGFNEITVCKLCGAPLEEILVEDYDIEDTNEFEENDGYENDIDGYEEDEIYEDKELEEKKLDYIENAEINDYDVKDEFNDEYIDNKDEEKHYENIKGNNLILYKDNEIFKAYELKYDEMIIGRNSSEFTPDIDLQEIDKKNAISRKHLLVYKEDDKYYIRNISKKCSVHIKGYEDNEARAVPFNESLVIEDGDFIVLSGKFILEAFFNEVEE